MPCRIQLAQLSGRKPKFQEEDYESTVGYAKVSSLLPHFSHLEQSTCIYRHPRALGLQSIGLLCFVSSPAELKGHRVKDSV